MIFWPVGFVFVCRLSCRNTFKIQWLFHVLKLILLLLTIQICVSFVGMHIRVQKCNSKSHICWLMHVLKMHIGCCHRHVLQHNQCVASAHHFYFLRVITKSRRPWIGAQPIGIPLRALLFWFFLYGFHSCSFSVLMCPWEFLAMGFDWWGEKSYHRRKTAPVIGGTRTQVLADSMTIAASVLNHCAT